MDSFHQKPKAYHSRIASQQIVEIVMNKFAQDLTQKAVHEAIPSNLTGENTKIFQSLTKMQMYQGQPNQQLPEEYENPAMKSDNFSTNKVTILEELRPRSSEATPRNRSRNRSIFSNRMKTRSIKSENKLKIASIKEESNPCVALPNKQSFGAISFSTDLLRLRMINIQELNKKEQEKKKAEDQQKLEKKRRLQRKIKQMNKFTNDYEGNFFAINSASQNTRVNTLFSDIPTDHQRSKKQIDKYLKMKRPAMTQIKNNRLNARNQRIKTEISNSEKMKEEGFGEDSEQKLKKIIENLKLEKNVKMFSDDLPKQSENEPKSKNENINNPQISKYRSLEEFKQNTLKFYKFHRKPAPKKAKQKEQKGRTYDSQVKLDMYQSIDEIDLASKYKSKPTLEATKKFDSSLSSPTNKNYPLFNNRFLDNLARKTALNLQKSHHCQRQTLNSNKLGKISIKNQKLFERTIDFNETYQ